MSTISREIKRGSVLQRDSSYLLYEHYYTDTAQIYYEKRRRNKRHHSHGGHTLHKKRLGNSIEQRPKEIEDRKTPLHWEGDLVKGVRRKNQPALMTLIERTIRFEVVIKIPDYRASTCQRLLQKEIDRHPDWFKSITFDNGSEFADMTKIKGCQIYFAHPYSPWERGTNENCNGLLRQFFPKGKSMKDKSKAYVQQATNAINHKHRRIPPQYQTAEELFKQYISS